MTQRRKSTILIVDDTETNIDILLDLLSDEYDILVALDGKSTLEIVESEKIDLILLDIMMPGMNGYEVCKVLKKQSSTKDIPVVFITAKSDEESIAQAFEVGGVDYISKPFKPLELLARVKTQIRIKHLVEDLERIASHDEMTGVYNRRRFFKEANEIFVNIGQNLYAIMIDIDKFKKVNDTYGHGVGDEVIKMMAHTVEKNMLEGSIFGRIGGEEFALLCYVLDEDEIMKNMQDIRKAVEKCEVITDEGDVIKFTISVGMAKSDKDTNSLDLLLKKADKAMYEAKDSGRNKAIFR